MTKRLKGVFTALVTPFDPSGAIDWAAFEDRKSVV